MYSGPQINPARVPGSSMPVAHPFAQQFQQAAANVTQQASAFDDAKTARQEFTLEQNRSAALQNALSDLNMEMLQRLQIADGQPNSLYDENGLIIQDEVDEMKSRYLSVADAWTSGFTSEQGMLTAAKAQQSYRENIGDAIDDKLLAGLKSRARNALRNNIAAAQARAAFSDADTFIADAESRGQISEAEAILLREENKRSQTEYFIAETDDPLTLADFLENKDNAVFLNSNSPIASAIRRKIDDLLECKATVLKEEVVSTSAADQEAANRKVTAPPASDGFLQLHFLTYGETEESLKTSAAQENAIALLSKFANTHLATTKPGDEKATLDVDVKARIRLLGKSLQLDSQTVEDIISAREKALDITVRSFNVSKAKTELLNSFKKSQGFAAAKAPAWKNGFADHAATLEICLNQAEIEFNKWFGKNGNADDITQARKFQEILTNLRKKERDFQMLRDNPAMGWNHMPLEDYIAQFTAAEEAATRAATVELHKIAELKLELESQEQIYEAIKNDPVMIQAYYRGDFQGSTARYYVNQVLAEQARSVKFDMHLSASGVAAKLPDSSDQNIIYVPKGYAPNTSRVFVQQGGDTFLVKIVEQEGLEESAISVALQEKLKLIGKKYNHLYFENNILTFTNISETKGKNILNTSQLRQGAYQYYGQDGLVPDSTEGLFAGTPANIEENPEPLPIP